MLFTTITISFFSFRYGWDPDNLVAPLITFLGDFLTLPFLFFSFDLLHGGSVFEKKLIFIGFLVATSYMWIAGLKMGEYCRRILIESLPILFVCAVLSSLSGSLLSTRVEMIITTAGILTLVPALLEDGGAMGGILSARLSSAFYLGQIKLSKKPPVLVYHLFGVMHILGLMIFLLLGSTAFVLNSIFGIPSPSFLVFVLAVVVTGQILIPIVNVISYYLAVAAYKIELNPDNVTIPIITSIMDIMGTGILIMVLVLLGIL